jgi:hypothetical protein
MDAGENARWLRVDFRRATAVQIYRTRKERSKWDKNSASFELPTKSLKIEAFQCHMATKTVAKW